MRMHIIAAIALASASAASAQTPPERPAEQPPAPSASFDARNDWCQKYAEWFVSRSPDKGPLPADVRPEHRLQVEVQFCQPNPPEYQRLTNSELNGTTSSS